MIDSRGNPLLISGVVRYFFEDTVRTALECQQPNVYVELLAQAVLKNVVSRFPYETTDGSPCLKSDSEVVEKELKDNLQARVQATGAQIISLSLNEIAYAPEISQAMLKRQQAFAIVDARQQIVQGAVDVASEAVEELQQKGHNLEANKGRIVANLLTILCSEKDVVPVLSMGK